MGLTLSDTGVLTATSAFADLTTPYKVVVKLDGQPWYGYSLTYRTKVLTTGTFKGFGSAGDLGGFSLTSKSGYHLTNETGGTLKYTKDAGVATDNSVYLTFPITKSALEDEFYFLMDFKVVTASCKGYMFLKNASSGGTELSRAETHMYQPRIKFFTDSSNSNEKSFNASSGFGKDAWYTFVYHGTNMSSSSRKLHLDIYKTAELDAAGYTSTSNRDYTNVTNVTPVFSTDITPA